MECYECGTAIALEDHHCVFRSQSKAMINISLNKIKLCPVHHRGNDGPHKNREKDLEYKRLVQERLDKLFEKEFYTKAEIKKLLHTNIHNVDVITKTLTQRKEGYAKEDIIRELMGGKTYA